MVFSSITFLYYFLPAVLIIYYLTPKRAKNAVLLLSSFAFYFYGEPKYTLLMAASCLISYLCALLIERFKGKRLGLFYLLLCITACLAALLYFKYADFIISTVGAVIGKKISPLNLALPIGISFYTFQALSYAVDVYRGDVKAQRNLIDYSTYLALFPQLIAGPIVRYSSIEGDLTGRVHTAEGFAVGVRRFVIGLGKKTLLANTFGELTQLYTNSGEGTVLFIWLYAIAYCLQVYFDFSGYSDMAVGLGRMFGFRFPENFNYPFISKSIAEFWRRWHMTLGAWFRDYVYIPLGGNRVKKWRWALNILVVWALTGLWHGAAWNFVCWGLFFAVFLAVEKLLLSDFVKKGNSFFRHAYTLLLIAVSFVIFGAEDIAQAFERIKGMFGMGMPLWDGQALYSLRSYFTALVIGIIGATPLPSLIVKKISGYEKMQGILSILEPAALAALLLLSTAFLVDGSYNPFLYFRF